MAVGGVTRGGLHTTIPAGGGECTNQSALVWPQLEVYRNLLPLCETHEGRGLLELLRRA